MSDFGAMREEVVAHDVHEREERDRKVKSKREGGGQRERDRHTERDMQRQTDG